MLMSITGAGREGAAGRGVGGWGGAGWDAETLGQAMALLTGWGRSGHWLQFLDAGSRQRLELPREQCLWQSAGEGQGPKGKM